MLVAFIIVFIHYVADFVCQDESWAVGKSKNNKLLLYHTFTYSGVWCLVCSFLGCLGYLPISFLLFAPITFVIHTITDYFTSRINSKLYAKGKFGSPIPNFGFFSMIGFDQVLHYAQLFLTYHILINWK